MAKITTNGKVKAVAAGKTTLTKGVVTTKATCETEGVMTYTCAGCGETKTESIAATGHKYVSKVIEPTNTKQGYIENTCSACGDSYRDTYEDAYMEEAQLSEDEIYNIMIAFQEDYPEGKPWTNDDYYEWNGGYYAGGYGCVAFAFMLSDAAFGKLPVRFHEDFSNIRVGDILRMNHDTHSVIVLEVKSDSLILAEGNYNYSIHWGRELSFSEVRERVDFVMTRYPK